MNTQARLGLILIIGAVAVTLILIFTQNSGQKPSVTETPPATGATVTTNASVPTSATLPITTPAVVPGTTTKPSPTLEGGTPAPTPTPTNGELAAADVGTAKYSHYFPSVEECKRAVDNKEVKNCVAPDSIKQITQPEWTQLFPTTDFYVVGLIGRDQINAYDNNYRRELIAWRDGQAYSAGTYDRLLAANGIVITDTNRELVARAFVLTTLPDYIESEIVFSDWGTSDRPLSLPLRYNYALTVWTKSQ